MIWCFASSGICANMQTSFNYKQFLGFVKLWIQLNNATLLRHLFSAT